MDRTDSGKRTCILLTGATGLVGRFLVRRLLLAGHEVAVVVRAGARSSSAEYLTQQRIEQVLQPLEVDSLLRRPRVITWDLTEPAENFPEGEIQWLNSRPVVVVHCAASIRFLKDAVTGEPFRTNVNGTQNLLIVCQRLDVVAFHHISTAYVGQHRNSGNVFEKLTDGEQEGGNDYERSKIAAERLVSASNHIGRITIHRPSIVLGDSQTGYTSTFHGFYAPLNIGWQYARTFGFSEQAGEWFRSQLGLSSEDRKNMVTVDWVVECIARTLEIELSTTQHPPANLAPRVLHWTHPTPVSCNEIQSAIVDSIERSCGGGLQSTDANPWRQHDTANPQSSATNSKESSAKKAEFGETTDVLGQPTPEQFRSQMQAYESYFQSDPTFDTTQSGLISTGIRCPQVDYALLTRLADWAIAAGFGWPKPALPEFPHGHVVQRLRNYPQLEPRTGGVIVQMVLLGPCAPETLYFCRSDSVWYSISSAATAYQTWRVSLANLVRCLEGSATPKQLIDSGSWLVETTGIRHLQETENTLAEDWFITLAKLRPTNVD